ncbi:hypothetical protein A2W14_03895 [Candidatus Gottesmanbacteria bacterium RBG_16_37_8]|uniref:dTDP-4-dehydrorhamnose reductase n=1 Tax=Candidatus Gottesmanbacteria bacterium RBG_16_37_8 TaxID=1798371 RepID=A0A1F5YQQ3_9BACT|nr:MAG: hypothetical protein A2W14_03895 [Candidatus Gottesmanbacteria bacterium RBG_16_37_8]
MTTPVLATGLSGLVGTRIRDLLAGRFDFEDLSLTTNINITDSSQVQEAFENSKAQVVLHMAAKTDVDACEDDKQFGEEGGAWQVNVLGTENIAFAAGNTGKRIIYISTDFVFDGTKEFYSENDKPNPVSWYGYTKFLGEQKLLESDVDVTILRISYPYRNRNNVRNDFVHRLIDVMAKDKKVYGLTDHIFTPTFIDDIAKALADFLTRNLPGIYHLVGSSSLPTIEAVKLIRDTYHLKAEIIPIDRKTYFKDRAFRPFKLALKNDKIQKLGLKMLTFKQGLKEIKIQDS